MFAALFFMKFDKKSVSKIAYNGLGKVYAKLTGNDVLPYEEAKDAAGDGPVVGVERPHDDEPDKSRKKGGKGKLLLGLAMVIAFALTMMALLPPLLKSFEPPVHNEIKLADLIVTEKLTGMNHYGEITVAVDTGKVKTALAACIPDTESYTDDQLQAWTDGVVNYITLDAGKIKGLSNGDVVRITASFDEEQANAYPSIQFIPGTAAITITGLPDTKAVDALADDAIELVVSGTSGSATANLEIKLTGSYVYYLNYDWEPKSALSNGDIVTVSIKPDDQRMASLGYGVAGVRTREFTVTGLPEPVPDHHSIPDTTIRSMVSYAEGDLDKEFKALYLNNGLDEEDKVIIEPEITSIYFLDQANKSTPYTDWFSGLSMVNGIAVLGHFFVQDIEIETVKTGDPENPTAPMEKVVNTYGGYYVWVFPNIMQLQNGKVEYDMNMITRYMKSYQTESDTAAWMKSEFKGFSVEIVGSNSVSTTT